MANRRTSCIFWVIIKPDFRIELVNIGPMIRIENEAKLPTGGKIIEVRTQQIYQFRKSRIMTEEKQDIEPVVNLSDFP